MRTPAAVAILLISAGGAPAATPEEVAAICEEAARRYQEQFGSAQGASPEPVVAMYKHTFCPRRLTVKQGAATLATANRRKAFRGSPLLAPQR